MCQEWCKFNNPFNIPQYLKPILFMTVLFHMSHLVSSTSIIQVKSFFSSLAHSSSSSQSLSPAYSRTNSEAGPKEHLTCLFSVLVSVL